MSKQTVLLLLFVCLLERRGCLHDCFVFTKTLMHSTLLRGAWTHLQTKVGLFWIELGQSQIMASEKFVARAQR